MTLTIEQNVPLPSRAAGTGRKMTTESQLALKMKPGDSILCPDEVVYKRIIKTLWKNNRAYASRKTPDGFRVWRVDGRTLAKAANA